jgi:DNA-directed RNA polymerase subunit E'/Rpb7
MFGLSDAHLAFRSNLFAVEFRIVVFRPFKGEVLQGRITSGTQAGVHSKLRPSFTLSKLPDR